MTQPSLDEKLLFTFKIIQLFNPSSTSIEVYNYERLILSTKYNTLFDESQVLFLRMGVANAFTQKLQLDNLRTQTLCYTQSYVDYLATQSSNPNAKTIKNNNINSNIDIKNIKAININNKKLYLILFGITLLINIIIIICAITVWNNKSNNILFCNDKSGKGYATFDESSDTDNDEDILVPANKIGRQNRKGYAAIVAVSESDME